VRASSFLVASYAATIDFDDELEFVAGKIGNVRPYLHLLRKCEPFKSKRWRKCT